MNTLLQRGRAWIDCRLERRIATYSIVAILSASLIFGAVLLAAILWIIRQHQLLLDIAPLLLGYGLGMLILLGLALILSHQLARRVAEPLLALNHTARKIAAEGPAAELMTVHRADEIGELTASFNQMVVALRQAQKKLENQVQAQTQELWQALAKIRQSEEQIRAILDSVPYHIAMLDSSGVIVAVNEPWQRFTLENESTSHQPAQHTGVGANYLAICREAIGERSAEAIAACDGIQAVLSGQRSSFSLEYPCHSPREQRWFVMRVTPLGTADRGVVIAHADITERHQMEQSLRESEERYRSALTALAEGVVVYNLQGEITATNPAAERILGLNSAQYQERTVDDGRWSIIRPDGTPFLREEWPSVITMREGISQRDVLMGVYTPDNSLKWIMVGTEPIHDPVSGALQAAVVSFNDITARKIAEDALRVSESRFHTLVDLLPYGVQENDLTGCIIFANLALERLHGYPEGGLVGRFIWDFMADDTSCASLYDYLQFLVSEQPLPTSYFTKIRRADGSIIDIQVDWTYRRDAQGQLQGFISVITDITDRKRMEEALRQQAIRDPLTGLFNRRYLDEALPRELHRCQRSEEPLTVAMLDLDHFKHFNDIYGHVTGDTVLRSIGDLLSRSVRAGDIACRYGGEELTIVMPGSTAENARSRLDDLRQAIMKLHLRHQDNALPVITVSIGAAEAEPAETDATALLDRADAALYQAKKQGRNRMVVVSG